MEEILKEILTHILTIEDLMAKSLSMTDEEVGQITERNRELVDENWINFDN